jgi:hypothetical protein
MTTAPDDRLRELLRRRMQQAAEEAATHDGDVAADQLEKLNRLARLVELRDKTFPQHARRWPLAALLTATLVLVSLLLFMRVSETEVELDVRTSEVGFVLSGPQVLTEITKLTELRASGVRAVQLSGPSISGQAMQTADNEGGTIRIAAQQATPRAGSITLAPLNLPADVGVRVYGMQPGGVSRLVLNHAPGEIRVTADGSVRVDLPGTESRDLDFAMPRSMLLETDSVEVNLELHAAPVSSAAFSPQLAVKDLMLSRIDEFQALDGTTAQNVSTILSGTLYLESLNGQARELRAGELLQFGDVRGVIRVLKQEDEDVALKFRGRVRGMRTGWGENTTSLMPTYLSWLQARHGLSLLWGTTVYLFGLVMALLRWWRVSV